VFSRVCAADAFAINGDREKLIATMLGTIMTLPNQESARSLPRINAKEREFKN